MIKYTISVSFKSGRKEYEVGTTTDERKAIKMACDVSKYECAAGGDAYIDFVDDADSNNHGFLNWDGRGPVGKAW
jgi:hypothetical protein